MARTHHPDKAAAEDREDADAKFKTILEAYEILYDEEKRAVYDQHGMSAFDGSGPGGMGDGFSMEDLMTEMFGNLGGMPGVPGMGGFPGQSGPRKPSKGEDEEKELPVTLEDLYLGKTQRFSATKSVVCGHCRGKGAKDGAKAKKCSSCKGQGKLVDGLPMIKVLINS